MIVSAVDVSRAFLAEGERLARREGRQVRFVHADVLALPFDDAAFDGAVSGGSLNEFVDAARALSEAARVLRDGAPLWLMYAARSETIVGRALQGALRASGLRFPAPAQVDAWAPPRDSRRSAASAAVRWCSPSTAAAADCLRWRPRRRRRAGTDRRRDATGASTGNGTQAATVGALRGARRRARL
jgi:SAM-dependent methyltransferase